MWAGAKSNQLGARTVNFCRSDNAYSDFAGRCFLKTFNGTHSSTLAWTLPWMEEPDGLQSMESLRVGHD